jgi:NitT/TauT family transport system permease protein
MSEERTTVRPDRPRAASTAVLEVDPEIAARARRRRTRERTLVLLLRVSVIVVILAGMYLLNARSGNLTMPKPSDVFDESVKMWRDGTMLRGLRESLTVLVFGFLTAAASGIIGGLLLGGFRLVGRVFDPFVHALNATPSAAFIPLIIVWFGLFTEAKIVVVWIAAFFPILISTASGIDQSDNDLIEMARSFGASRFRLFWQVMLPSALPSILSGLRIGAAVATVGTVIAELQMAQSGLGGLLSAAGNRFEMDRYFAVVLVLMVIGTLITGGLRLVEYRFWNWRASQRDANR